MGERTSYVPGTPCWVDLGTPDLAAAVAFYGGLFGWEHNAIADPAAGGYGMLTHDGKAVAGLGPAQNEGAPPYWATYISVTDADASAAAIKDAGGSLVVEPMDVMSAGRMAVAMDPQGSIISIWQAGDVAGAELVNEPGAWGWNELATTDLAKTNAFYQAVFDWGLDPNSSSDSSSLYTVAGRMVCGAHTAGEGEPPFWSVWFSTEDCDAAAAKVTELGGSILMPPGDMDFGRGAVAADPQGAAFGIAWVKPDMIAP